MEEKKYLKWYNKVGYGSGDIAGNVVFAFLSSFIMIYLTNTVGLNAGVIGSLIAASKVLDGISDVVFGSMIDRTHTKMGTIDPQHQFPVSIESTGDCLNQQNVKWIRSLNSESGKTTIKDSSELTGLAKKAQNQIMTGDKYLILPLISYYGTGRLYAQKKEKRNLKSLTEFKRQVGYVDCMAAESNEKLMLNWFQMQTLKSLQEQQKTGILDSLNDRLLHQEVCYLLS